MIDISWILSCFCCQVFTAETQSRREKLRDRRVILRLFREQPAGIEMLVSLSVFSASQRLCGEALLSLAFSHATCSVTVATDIAGSVILTPPASTATSCFLMVTRSGLSKPLNALMSES